MRKNTIKFYRKVKNQYDFLYNEKRLRHDDVIEKLMDDFCISSITVYRIFRTELPNNEVENTSQIDLFAELSTPELSTQAA